MTECSLNSLPDELLVKIMGYVQPNALYLPQLSLVCKRWHTNCGNPALWRYLQLSSQLYNPKYMESMLKCWTNVITLDLSHCCNYIADEHLRIIGKHCHKLSRLYCNGCKLITNKGLNYIGQGCKKLRTLSLHSCHEITCQGVSYVTESCVNLEELILSDCDGLWKDPHKIKKISTYCTHLKRLSLACSDKYKGIVLDMDIKQFALFCFQLKQLNVQSSQITDQSLGYIARYCVALQSLNLSHCLITDTGLACRFPNLKHLDLTGCWHVTDVGIWCISLGCTNLVSLSLAWCFQISDKAINYLVNCSKLTSLDISHCFAVSDVGLQTMLLEKPNLCHLNITGLFFIQKNVVKNLQNIHPKVSIAHGFDDGDTVSSSDGIFVPQKDVLWDSRDPNVIRELVADELVPRKIHRRNQNWKYMFYRNSRNKNFSKFQFLTL